ncbi:MAG: hypothetical protein ACRD97_07590 [Nitrososphaeraceae archaeon]
MITNNTKTGIINLSCKETKKPEPVPEPIKFKSKLFPSMENQLAEIWAEYHSEDQT